MELLGFWTHLAWERWEEGTSCGSLKLSWMVGDGDWSSVPRQVSRKGPYIGPSPDLGLWKQQLVSSMPRLYKFRDTAEEIFSFYYVYSPLVINKQSPAESTWKFSDGVGLDRKRCFSLLILCSQEICVIKPEELNLYYFSINSLAPATQISQHFIPNPECKFSPAYETQVTLLTCGSLGSIKYWPMVGIAHEILRKAFFPFSEGTSVFL